MLLVFCGSVSSSFFPFSALGTVSLSLSPFIVSVVCAATRGSQSPHDTYIRVTARWSLLSRRHVHVPRGEINTPLRLPAQGVKRMELRKAPLKIQERIRAKPREPPPGSDRLRHHKFIAKLPGAPLQHDTDTHTPACCDRSTAAYLARRSECKLRAACCDNGRHH